MRIHTRVEFEWSDELQRYVVAHEEGYEYDGPVESCGGGPDPTQTRAAQAQEEANRIAAQDTQMRQAREAEQYGAIKPYAMDRLNNGLPYMSSVLDQQGGTTARAFAPVKAQVARTVSNFGTSLPTGFGTGAMTDVNSEQARAYDDALYGRLADNENVKSEAARLLTQQQQIANPIGAYQANTAGNNSILSATSLQRPGIGGILGGILEGAAGSAMKAFCPAGGSLITKGDGTTDMIELMKQLDSAAQLNSKPSHFLDTPQPVIQACVEVITQNGRVSVVGITHCYVLASGGYCCAFEAQGMELLSDTGPDVVKEVNVAGFRLVYPIHVGGNHTYCTDGLWSLE